MMSKYVYNMSTTQKYSLPSPCCFPGKEGGDTRGRLGMDGCPVDVDGRSIVYTHCVRGIDCQ